jgi:hypothetical protein
MKDKRLELIELIELGYEFEALMNIGNGWQPYEGCQQNLIMILEDQDTEVSIIDKDSPQFYTEGIRRYNVILPIWWRPGALAISFDVRDLDII